MFELMGHKFLDERWTRRQRRLLVCTTDSIVHVRRRSVDQGNVGTALQGLDEAFEDRRSFGRQGRLVVQVHDMCDGLGFQEIVECAGRV